MYDLDDLKSDLPDVCNPFAPRAIPTVRYSGKLKRKPGVFTRASGIIRVRPMSPAEEGRELPASSRLWPKLASFTMNLDLPEKFRHRKRPDRGKDGGDDKILRK